MAIYDILKDAGTVLKEAGKIELYAQILDVQEKMLGMQKRIIDLEETNRELKEKIEIKQNLVVEDNLYWIIKNEKRDGPFCTKCQDSTNKLIRLHTSRNSGSQQCPECKTYAHHGQVQIYTPPDQWRNSSK